MYGRYAYCYSSVFGPTISLKNSYTDSPILKNKFFFSDMLKNSSSNLLSLTAYDEIEKYCNEKVFISEDFEVVKW